MVWKNNFAYVWMRDVFVASLTSVVLCVLCVTFIFFLGCGAIALGKDVWKVEASSP